MPLLPTIGLSAIIHLIVIIIYGRRSHRSNITRHFLPKNKQLFAVGIVICISFFILIGAWQLISLSIYNQNSTLFFARKQIERLDAVWQSRRLAAPTVAGVSEIALSSVSVQNSIAIEEIAPVVNCEKEFIRLASIYNFSIVDFLRENGLDNSFGSRLKFAQGSGLDNYRGSPTENLRLFCLYLIHLGMLPGADIEQCIGLSAN